MQPAERAVPSSTRADWIRAHFEQIESQVQFGDAKAGLLVAGDAILLTSATALMAGLSGCANGLQLGCVHVTRPLLWALAAAGLLVVSLACALWAARPATVHLAPPPDLFLLSSVARRDQDEFFRAYEAANDDVLQREALIAIHRKSRFATLKFCWLRRSVHAALLSLALLVLAVAEAGLRFKG